MKKEYMSLVIVFVIAITLCGAIEACEDQAVTTICAGVSSNAHYQIKYKWAIDKTATPDVLNLVQGDTGTSKYMISVVKDAGNKVAYVDGYVTITNNGNKPTQNLTVKVKLTTPGKTAISTDVDTSTHPILAPGETHKYYYKINLHASYINPASTYKINSDVTITNYAGHYGKPFGHSPSDTTKLPTPALINDKIHVIDSNGQSWIFSTSGFITYYKTFIYKGNSQDIYKNTAKIQETCQSASATVTVKWKPKDPPDDPSISGNITIGDNAFILDPSQNQNQNQSQGQSQNLTNINNNFLTNSNKNTANSDSYGNNTNNITTNNTFDPNLAINNLNNMDCISALVTNINQQIQALIKDM